MSKTDHTIIDDVELEGFFTAARDAAPAPSDALMARIMADAEAEVTARETVAARPGRRARPGLIASVIGALGGWPALAGMVTATIAGVWFGFAAPDQVNMLAGGLLWTDSSGSAVSYELEDIVPGGTGLATLFEESGA